MDNKQRKKTVKSVNKYSLVNGKKNIKTTKLIYRKIILQISEKKQNLNMM